VEDPLIELRRISKSFGGVRALDQVSFSVRRGEVHALVGENGAGKSTLLKLLAGVHQPDAGKILLDGRTVHFRGPRDAYEAGVSIVFQELNLFAHRSIAANVFANREWTRGFGWIDRKGMLQATSRVLQELNLTLSPETRVGQLPMAEKQLVEIARALAQESRILILDEPNSSLSEVESERLFEILRRLRRNNVTILYVSHRLEEVFAITDRITVLRDGQCRGTFSACQTSIPEVVKLMIGRSTSASFPERRLPSSPRSVIVEARSLCAGPRLGPISFSVRAGEILGFAGLEGAGVDRLFELFFGLQRLTAGAILFRGETLGHTKPWDRMRRGWAFLPRSRREQGLMMAWPTARNATLLILNQLRSWLGLIDFQAVRRATNAAITKLNIQGAAPYTAVWQLSGGNQQKVLLAKWLSIQPALLLLQDPTRGIDLAAKWEIYQLCHRLADQGIAILLTSSEMEEVMGLSDRVLVLAKGKLVREFQRGEATQSQLMHAMTSGAEPHHPHQHNSC
jgi:ribose transport system ATP-binding protein